MKAESAASREKNRGRNQRAIPGDLAAALSRSQIKRGTLALMEFLFSLLKINQVTEMGLRSGIWFILISLLFR